MALVLELIEGPTLADRIARGPIPVEQTLEFAKQIVDALEAAHEKGIVHRDLKPANVKITADGKVKVLDFGLAKGMTDAETSVRQPDVTHSPTLSVMATQAGVILGTAAYMSPEQAQALPVDHRSDIFSFGSLLYETLTGRPAFTGDTATAILASVLVREPDFALLPANLDTRLEDLVRRCLQKNPKQRWQAAGDLRAELEAVSRRPYRVADGRRRTWRTHAIPVALAVILTAALTSIAWWRWQPPMPRVKVVRFSVPLDVGQQINTGNVQALAISPDGEEIVYATGGQLYRRVLADLEGRAGEKRLVIDGVRRSDVNSVIGTAVQYAVSTSGDLVYVAGPSSSVTARWRALAFSDRKGVIEVLGLPPGMYESPRISPDGRRLAFELADDKDANIYVYDLDGKSQMRRVTFGGRNHAPVWSADGDRLAFQSDREGDRAIWWQRTTGEGAAMRLTKADTESSQVPESWSPDSQSLLFGESRNGHTKLMIHSLRTGVTTAFAGVESDDPINSGFSPDGRWVAYTIREKGGSAHSIYVQPFPPTGAIHQISKGEDAHHALWSRDGKELSYIPGPLRFVSVPVTTQPSFAIGQPTSIPRGFTVAGAPTNVRGFDITPDGNRFVGVMASGAINELQVVLNWVEELKRLVPLK